MVKYVLRCENTHSFEAWFPDSNAYEIQRENNLINCPFCQTSKVEKAIMAPNIRTSKKAAQTQTKKEELLSDDFVKAMEGIKNQIRDNFDYVGRDFAEEARAIHNGEKAQRLIYGESSNQEISELIDEGVPIAPIPPMANPKGDKKLN